MKTKFDFERVWEGKRALRKRLSNSPIAEKLRMLDALRERAVTIGNRNVAPNVLREEPPTSR